MRQRVLLQGANRFVTPLLLSLGASLAAFALTAELLSGTSPNFGFDQAVALMGGIVLVGFGLVPAPAENKLVALGSVLASVVATEAVLRLSTGAQQAAIYRLDERYLHCYIAGASKIFLRTPINGGQTIHVSINSQGFRGEELLPAGSAKRLLVYGDSTVAAEFSDLRDTFVEQLEGELSSALAIEVEGINAGVVAYGPDQMAKRMEDELPHLDPDLVIVSIFVHNDFGDLLRNKLYRLDLQGQLRENRFAIGQPLRLQYAYARARDLSFLYAMLHSVWYRWHRLTPSPQADQGDGIETMASFQRGLERARFEYEDFVLGGNNVVENLFRDPYDSDVSLEPDSESARYKVALMDGVVGRMAEVAQLNGVPVAILVVPSKFDVAAGFPEPVDVIYPSYRPRNLSQMASLAAERRGIPHLDLFDVFQERDADGLYFLGDDHHWNDEAQQLAARRMRDLILRDDRLRDALAED